MSLRALLILLLGCFLSACTYQNKLPRGIYTAENKPHKMQARVLVASDQVAQKQFIFKDYHSKNSVHSYKINLTDGALVAAADALGTVFTDVEVNPSRLANKYDFVVQLTYTVSDGKNDSGESVQWLNYAQIPDLETRVQLLFMTPEGEEIYAGYATRRNRVELNNETAVTQRMENTGTLILLPLTAPVYTQQMGESLLYTLSRDLRECLEEIIADIPLNDFQVTQNNVK